MIPDSFDPDEILPARAGHLVNLERRGFIAGAQWRINSVWHDAQEEPCNGKILIVETKNYGIFIAGPNIDTKDYECLKKEFDINRWAYIEDLLPADSK